MYIIINLNDSGKNMPTTYTARMKASEMIGLTSSAFKNFEDIYDKIKQIRNIFNRQLALDSKIQKVDVRMLLWSYVLLLSCCLMFLG
jgi:hypothetical protein